MQFSKQKNGYNISEVDLFFEKMKNDYEEKLKARENALVLFQTKIEALTSSIKTFQNKKDNISSALIAAVDKAKQIENSSKNVYKLKIEQINLLYGKWETLLSEMLTKYPDLKDTVDVKELIASFQKSIQDAISEDLGIPNGNKISGDNDPIRILLGKMSKYSEKANMTSEPKVNKIARIRDDEKEPKFEERPIVLKPIINLKLDKNDGFNSIADKFLSDTNNCCEQTEAHIERLFDPASHTKPGESGFDLQEAINPKEDLDEIMKSFD
ncbi:MAG: DivIVA domain-containing protein, partial [Clostridia bacterium]